jgi:hypothetical protein
MTTKLVLQKTLKGIQFIEEGKPNHQNMGGNKPHQMSR